VNTVLVIDDEGPLREIVRLALSSGGYEVIEADNGTTGLELARTQKPALVLSDVNMDGIDGYTLIQRLRQDKLTAAIPVILMTGVMKDYSSVRRAMGIGADDYLLKPFTVDDLLTAVRTRLQKQQLIEEKAESKIGDLRANLALSLPHELRTPLASILGFSDVLKSDCETMDRKEIGAMAVDIRNAATRLHGLIENYLIYAQIEMMRVDERRVHALRREQTADLQQIVKIVSHQKAEEYKRPGDLHLNLLAGSATISAGFATKIFVGLLDNAFKFSEPGTPVHVSSFSAEQSFTVVFADKGRGMSSEQIENVGGYMQFDRRMYEQQGSGLGLIIAQRLAELHGGSLAIESKIGTGTTVTVKLPLP
jgi:two-component system sensor histidine kinase/response regulator